ncbi:fluoride efflux transporter CrcB [Terribacillus sp. DMT04]|uniref:fluoride efflux transporter CrcB n=1 Tax=Terribacillus sp. DMT04 TaxID=2850441 RepID=UPI001C2C12AE|nr:fluoride efflux transporter CrcB [Terribacillus sp. DMT04]QXE02146.1 fluoride efflux transporter CrcB [Terribacillus sp. DMT04]
MKIYLAIGCGGSIGALLRYLVGVVIPQTGNFPIGTLIINTIGCFLMGYFTNLVKQRYFAQKQALAKALTTGMVGAFTTFSTVSLEAALLLQENMASVALIYLIISSAAGLGALMFGLQLAPNPAQRRRSA